jgi:hypothetical protein
MVAARNKETGEKTNSEQNLRSDFPGKNGRRFHRMIKNTGIFRRWNISGKRLIRL